MAVDQSAAETRPLWFDRLLSPRDPRRALTFGHFDAQSFPMFTDFFRLVICIAVEGVGIVDDRAMHHDRLVLGAPLIQDNERARVKPVAFVVSIRLKFARRKTLQFGIRTPCKDFYVIIYYRPAGLTLFGCCAASWRIVVRNP